MERVFWNMEISWIFRCGSCGESSTQLYALLAGAYLPFPSLPAGWNSINGSTYCGKHLIELRSL